jgi:ATP-dependent Lon protease
MDFQEKINKYFEGKVVRKDLAKIIKGNAVVPSYVLEYLLGQHCASADDEIINQGLEKVKTIIRDHFVNRDEAEFIKSVIREKGKFKIIDKVSAVLNEKKDVYEAMFSNLGIKRIIISSQLIKQHKKILAGGVWSIITLEYFHNPDEESPPWLIVELKPIQISKVDLEEYIALREEFTKDEWVDLLIQSMGFVPSQFTFRSKLIQLSRLIPFCENNYNYIELGPKGTGKSHIFSELSPHGILISGGDVTIPKLFVNNATGQIGLVGFWDAITFDEFAGSNKSVDRKLVDIMKNYMANKTFSRGTDVMGATGSFVFVGNTEHSVAFMIKNAHLFIALPKAYIDSAFLDRIHTYVPGWEVDKLRGEMFTSGYGFIVDYLAEILKELRKDDFSQLLNEFVELDKSITTRDRDGILKTFSGLAKIIYPSGKLKYDEAIELINFAIEGRKRVKDQLLIIDDTFEKVNFGYLDRSSNKIVKIDTLENKKYKLETELELIEQDNNAQNVNDVKEEKPKPILKPKHVSVMDNQEGISYDNLFADYIKGSTEITLVDPYLRYPYQLNYLLEFCLMIVKNKKEEEEINLKVITWNEPDEMIKSTNDTLEEISQTVFDLGIKLTWEFNPNIHDRYIDINNGWKIILGRGLDIYLKPEGRYNIAGIWQEKRKCKACEIIYILKEE